MNICNICISVYIYMCKYICTYIYTCVCVCVRVYVCVKFVQNNLELVLCP